MASHKTPINLDIKFVKLFLLMATVLFGSKLVAGQCYASEPWKHYVSLSYEDRILERYEFSEYIFLGKLIKSTSNRRSEQIKVLISLKGDLSYNIVSIGGGSSKDFYFEEGGTYIVFADKIGSDFYAPQCHGTFPITKEQGVKLVKKLKKKSQ
ncbi:hypothetical protein [Pleionea sediminis]|uniref:hypothetical protein n=1 Tax=Pleionea sediminis TaxID=2569479 RepID=UPI001184A054|nr:hypothetical protein [Pleionea sediminis]